MTHTEIDSPIGPLLLTSDGDGDGDALTGLYMRDHKGGPGSGPGRYEDEPTGVLREAADQLHAYFAGTLNAFDLPLAPRGTAFQLTVWDALTEIPFGETWSYGELALHIGRPGAARAVGLANGRNPISIIVPCHRVIGSSGDLTGYGGGIERKRFLLAHEGKLLV